MKTILLIVCFVWFLPGLLSAKPDAPVYTVFTRHYMERGNSKTLPKPTEIDKPLIIAASPGEYEPVTFAIRSEKLLKDVKVELTGNLKSSKGSIIPKNQVDIRIVTRMKQWLSSTEYKQRECYLIRNRRINIPVLETQRYWLTVHVPNSTAAGIYAAKVRISASNAPVKELALKVRVYPIALERPVNMNYFMYFGQSWPTELSTKEQLRKVFEDMREHGMTTTTLYAYPSGSGWIDVNRDRNGLIPMATQMDVMRSTGLIAPWASIPWLGAECYGPDVWSKVLEISKKRKWPELLFYIVDEPSPGRYERVDAAMKQVAEFRKQYPQYRIRTTTAGASDEKVCHYYDVWIVGAGQDEAILKKGREMGKAIWMYDCSLAPVDALTDRYYFGIWSWKAGIKGVSHWSYYDGLVSNRFGIVVPWKDTESNLTEYTHQFNYIYPTSDGPVPSIGWEGIREGIDDYRYIYTLEKTIEKAKRTKSALKLIKESENLLNLIRDSVHYDNLRKERSRAAARAGEIRDFDRQAPEPALKPADYDRFRYQIAQHIIKLNEAMGVRFKPTAAKLDLNKPRPSTPSLVIPLASSTAGNNAREDLWDNCEDIDQQAPIYAQPRWNPNAYVDFRIGQITVSTDEKSEGKGSIRWVVTKNDVDEKEKKLPKYGLVALHKLYGQSWENISELVFDIKIENPNHPPISCMIIGSKAANLPLLDRGQVTNGWKEIRWNMREADIGTSEQYGKLMNYFRLWTSPEAFKEGEVLDVYLDNFRLVTQDSPKDLTNE